jgi:hypothetical protein
MGEWFLSPVSSRARLYGPTSHERLGMGGHIYYYAVPYESDINKALQSLRMREFEAVNYPA